MLNKRNLIFGIFLSLFLISCEDKTFEGEYEMVLNPQIPAQKAVYNYQFNKDGNWVLTITSIEGYSKTTGPYFIDPIDENKELLTAYLEIVQFYNRDGDFLEDEKFPKMRQAIEFTLYDTYIEDKDGLKYKKKK